LRVRNSFPFCASAPASLSSTKLKTLSAPHNAGGQAQPPGTDVDDRKNL
jgi:hypothetical protein